MWGWIVSAGLVIAGAVWYWFRDHQATRARNDGLNAVIEVLREETTRLETAQKEEWTKNAQEDARAADNVRNRDDAWRFLRESFRRPGSSPSPGR